MSIQFIIIMFLVIAVVFSIAVAIGIYAYERRKKSTLSTAPKDDWLFGNFQDMVYDLVFPKEPKSETVCGINIKEYENGCKILHQPNQMKSVVALRIEGIAVFLVCAILAFVTMSNIVIACVFLCIGMGCFYAMWMLPNNNFQNQVKERLYAIQNDLPRFLSLMEKAMDLPIDQAMLVTAQQFDSPLSEDILDSINKVSLGANGWQETLYDLAKTYNIEAFSDLVLEIINAYDQGVDIRELVNRKISEVEEDRLLSTQEHDSRIKTLIYLPIIGLKIVPLMVLVCLPMLSMYF